MRRRHVAISLFIAALISAVFLWAPAPKAALPQTDEEPQEIAPPAQVVYSALFHHVATVKDLAEAEERKGKDARSLRSLFREKADLSEVQAHLLDVIAADCVREVAAQDARARAIISAFKLRFPPGKLPAGVKLPPPPPELKQMQEERDAMILRARDRLRLAFGQTEFQRFEGFVAWRVAIEIEPAGLRPRSSDGRETERNGDGVIRTEGGR